MGILEDSLKDVPIVKKGDYNYFVHPITDGVPLMTRELLEDVLERILAITSGGYTKVVGVESMGIPLSTAYSLKTGVPQVIVRKRSYGLKGEVEVSQKTGYSKGTLYINGVGPGDRLLLLDDVFSTGGTIRAVIKGLLSTGAALEDVVIVFDKSQPGIKEEIEEETGVEIKTLLRVDVSEGRVVML
ncbi:MAG: adenine phosphoribosyltransferase [Thermoplasmata archaeon]|nr:MAG: adenine phosphoribosyltransferase [Thermoplasmata archaeon]